MKNEIPSVSMYSEIIRKHSQLIRLDFAAVGERAGGAPGLDPVIEKRGHNASASLQDGLIRNRRSGKGGVYAVCSAHPRVIDASVKQTIENDSFLHVESTSSQVNQLGGYSGQTPSQFAEFVKAAARRMGLSEDRILLSGDHLGPFPWRTEASDSVLPLECKAIRAGEIRNQPGAIIRYHIQLVLRTYAVACGTS